MNGTRAAVYLRISLDQTGERLGVQRQREDAERIASERGWTIVETYEDNSISASKVNVIRPAYNKLVSDFENRHFSAIICQDLDRFTRKPRELEDWIDASEKRGLAIVTMNGEADLTTDGGRLFARLKVAVARAEVERKGARQRRALRQRADLGRAPLGVRLTGYERFDPTIHDVPEGGSTSPSAVVVEQEAAAVRDAFTWFTLGDSLRSIAARLSQEHPSVSPRRSATWTPSSVRTMLMNPRYAGRAVYRGEPTGKRGDWAPIVPDDVFDSAQAILRDPRRITNRVGTDRKYLGSGLYLCGICGTAMRSHSGGRYRCPEGHVVRSAGPVDEFVTEVVVARLRRRDMADLLAGDEDGSDAGAEVERQRQRLETLEADYDEDRIDGRRYAVKRAKIMTELEAAEKARARAAGCSAVGTLVSAPDPGDAFLAAPLGVRRSVLQQLLAARLHRGVRGSRAFDPESVEISWA